VCTFLYTELLAVEHPGDYKKDVWEMNEEEKIKAAQVLREEGKVLYKASKHAAASEKFGKAIAIIEQLMLREKPKEPEWWALEEAKRPLLINYALCKMQLKEYYDVIERTSEVLKNDETNVKALFNRAKAHAKIWNFNEARSDFAQALKLDTSLEKPVMDELESLERLKRQKDKEEAQQLKGKLFS
jgi:AH receptor-interacting protein